LAAPDENDADGRAEQEQTGEIDADGQVHLVSGRERQGEVLGGDRERHEQGDEAVRVRHRAARARRAGEESDGQKRHARQVYACTNRETHR